jgi:hypothetical protein
VAKATGPGDAVRRALEEAGLGTLPDRSPADGGSPTGSASDGGSSTLCEFPRSYVDVTETAGRKTTMGPSVGQMLKAIKERSSEQDVLIVEPTR